MLKGAVLGVVVALAASLHAPYHSAASLRQEFNALADSCPLVTVGEQHGQFVVDIASKPAPALKSFLLFGEHPRELISPELSLNLAKHLCANPTAAILSKAQFRMVPLANKWGRAQLEAGNDCIRCNEDGVDLNRNWASHWQAAVAADSTNSGCTAGSGPKAFSEPETQGLQALLTGYKPHMFVSVHSGALGMYTPHAFDQKVPQTGAQGAHEAAMLDMLAKLNTKSGDCPYGAAGKEVGYTCPGTCLDYAFEQVNVPYSFAFEIFNTNRAAVVQEWKQHQRRLRFQSSRSFRGAQALLEVSHEEDEGFIPPGSCMLETRSLRSHRLEGLAVLNNEDALTASVSAGCSHEFNPSPSEYEATLKEWTERTLYLTELISEHHARR